MSHVYTVRIDAQKSAEKRGAESAEERRTAAEAAQNERRTDLPQSAESAAGIYKCPQLLRGLVCG
jgi:hypothetical protein